MNNHSVAAAGADSTAVVSLFDIFPNPWNPHRMTEDEQNALIESVREDGQWRPILVVEMDEPDEYSVTYPARYRIVDGFHLWTALCALHSEGAIGPAAKVMILGKNSELGVVRQMDIGQTMNHGLRGSIEDPIKTQQVIDRLLTRRAPEEVARRMSIGAAGVRHLATPPARPVPASAPTPGLGLSSGVQSTAYQERKMSTLALVFTSNPEMKEFEASLERFAHLLDPEVDYHNRRGQRRIDIMKAVLTQLQLRERA